MENQNAAASSGSFIKAFVPGLVLGLIVGSLAGAFLPGVLGTASLPEPKRVGPSDHIAPAESRDPDPDVATPPASEQQPAPTEPQQPPATPPGTPPGSPPQSPPTTPPGSPK